MTEAVLASIAKSALTLFTSLAKDESILLWNSEQEFEMLQDTFETVSCFLRDADKMYSEEDGVQKCLSKLRKTLYDVDDFFDGLAAKALRKRNISGGSFTKEVRIFFSKSNQVSTAFKIAHKVKRLKTSLDLVGKNMSIYGYKEAAQPVQVRRDDRDETHSFVTQGSVIGRKEEIDRIISMLLHESEAGTSQTSGFSVVAVIGFGGLGKTTLAQSVYNDEKVTQHFDVCLWSCINNLSKLSQVLSEIIASKEKKHGDLGLEQLQQKLRSYIGGKRFLLVIDDLWDESKENWRKLKEILGSGVNGKVLVTTRSIKVAQNLDAERVDLEVLSDEDALALFEKQVGEIGNNAQLKPLGERIMSWCGNVPLALVIVGSLLRHRHKDVHTWSSFIDNELAKESIRSDSDEIQKHIKAVLMVSYKDLRPNLKRCFAYCSLFPKDYQFYKHVMIRLWISQGFIEQNDDNTRNLEEIGKLYFSELVDRCFFQHSYIEGDRHFHYEYVKVHDLLHDVAIDVAKTEIFLLDKDHTGAGSNKNIRHISVAPEVDDSYNYCDMVSRPNRVRSILSYGTRQAKRISPGSLSMLLTNFRAIRTLYLPGLGFESISGSIGELVHLRYVDFTGNEKLRHLPNSICNLPYLTTISVQYCRLLEKLPPKIEKLVSLRHLLILGCYNLKPLPPGLENLTSLVKLDQLIVHGQSGGLGYLHKLNNLSGTLRVDLPRHGWPNAIGDAKRSKISEKHKLTRLFLTWNQKSVERHGETVDEAGAVLEALEPHENLQVLAIGGYGGKKLPGWICMLKNLTELSLSDCGHLEYLEEEMKDNIGFPLLKTLSFERMKVLKGWWRQEIPEESKRPRLSATRRVTIRDCPELIGPMPLLKVEEVEWLCLDRVDVKLVTTLLIPNPNSNLRLLELSGIKGLIRFPKGQIHLQRLEIVGCTHLRGVSRLELGYLVGLKALRLDCEIVDEDDDNTETRVGMPWKTLQSLGKLKLAVWDRQFAEGLAYLTYIKELEIGKWESEEDVELASKMLKNLRRLTIGFDHKTCDLRKTGIQNLPFLTTFSIKDCKELYLNWDTLLSTTKLRSLTFVDVEKVTDVENTVMKHPSQLQVLKIYSIRIQEWKWIHDIPWKSLTFLERLRLEDRKGEIDEQIPDGIQHLSSLWTLYISGWKSVNSVPTWLPKLTSLQDLSIEDCSEELRSRCHKENGLDRHLIDRLDNISINQRQDLQNESEFILDESNKEEEAAAQKAGCCGLITT